MQFLCVNAGVAIDMTTRRPALWGLCLCTCILLTAVMFDRGFRRQQALEDRSIRAGGIPSPPRAAATPPANDQPWHVYGATVPATTVTYDTRACQPPYDALPFCDTSLSVDARVADLVARLQPEEIVPLLTARHGGGGSPGPDDNVTRLGLPEYDWGMNAMHGAWVCGVPLLPLCFSPCPPFPPQVYNPAALR